MNKEQLKKDLDALFDNTPLDETVESLRKKVSDFIDERVSNYEDANLDEQQTKYLLIEFE